MKEVEKFTEISSIDEIIAFLEKKGRNHNYYHHYTSWDSFAKIYLNMSFLLTRGNSLLINDQHEALMKGSWQEWNKTYIGSFSYGSSENMAMWGLYGLPWQDAVRISIPKKAMLKWLDSIESVQLWDGHPYGMITGKMCLCDIVYVNGEAGSNALQLTYRGNTVNTKSVKGLHGVANAPEMTGYIKNYSWQYENEVRLRVKLNCSTGYEKIMLKIPEEVRNEIEVTTGPSFQYKDDPLFSHLQQQGKVHASAFENLVRYRPLCDLCKYHSFERKS